MIGDTLAPEIEAVAEQIVDAAFAVHSTLGPGLLESANESAMAHELSQRRCRVRRQVAVPLVYKGVRLDADLRLDMLVSSSRSRPLRRRFHCMTHRC